MPLRELSEDQLDVLISFAEDNPHLAFGRVPTTNPDIHYEYEFKWKEVMRDINHLDMEKAQGVREYRAYWTKLKTKVQTKLNRARRQLKMSQKPTKVALTDYELRIFNAMPKNGNDKYLVIEPLEDKNANSNISIKEEHRPPSHDFNMDKRVETVLNGLDAIAASIQNVARIQVELTKGQLEMVKSMNNMAELFKKIKQDYTSCD